MKHNLRITVIILLMFIMTQFIGLYVINHYSSVRVVDGNVVEVESPDLPFGLEPPQIEKESDYYGFFTGIIIAFILAILLFLLFTKFKIELVLKIWFFLVVGIALVISLMSIFSTFVNYALILAVVVALPLTLLKIYGRNFIVHNATELFIYPGIAAIFVPILNVYTIIGLLIIISVYDVWAVWHSGIMQKMAKYQINQLKIFSGFFVPYFSKQVGAKIKAWGKKMKKTASKKKVKINVAILGGGDIVFPIITAGVMLKTLGLVSAILVIVGATLGLTYLFFFAEKKKFYPAMPFITVGILIAIGISYLFSLI